jgi:uncharacterized membrane protein
LQKIHETVTTDLRLAALGICFLACVLFAITISIDLLIQKGHIFLPSWVSVGNVDDARILLSSIIQAVSTVLGLVFSVVLLVLSMAASQFGPRLLRRFILEYNGQITIGLFTATFLFSLLNLVVVRSNNEQEFVPQITTLTSVLLMIISFASLITFSERIRKGIQTGNLIARVTEDLSKSLNYYIQERKSCAREKDSAQQMEDFATLVNRCNDEGSPILADHAGYLQFIDYGALVTEATTSDTVISLKVKAGNFIIRGTILAYVIPAEKGKLLHRSINNKLVMGPNRTLTQDPEFAFAQIIEIGIRALSPAINDSFTGIACVDWLSNAILSMVDLPAAEGTWSDKDGHIRIVEVPVKFPRLVDAAFNMIRESGAGNPAILIRLLQNFIRMAPHLKTNEQRAALLHQVTAIREHANSQALTQTDLNDLIEFYNKACNTLKML